MAHQTSKIPQKQSTPRSIGRLMDADFFGVTTSVLVAVNEPTVAAAWVVSSCRSLKSRDVRSPKHAGTEAHQGDKIKLAHSPDRQTQVPTQARTESNLAHV